MSIEQISTMNPENTDVKQAENNSFFQSKLARVVALTGSVIALCSSTFVTETQADDATIPTQVAFDAIAQSPVDKVVRGGRFAVEVDASGTAEDFKVKLVGHTRNDSLMKRYSIPTWHTVAGKPTWQVGQLQEEKNSHVSFSMKVSKHAKIGSKACATVRQEADPLPATLETYPDMKPNILDTKVCVKVARHR